MKKIIVASIALLLITGIATKVFSEEIVQKGDTLWDISMKYLQTPWNWPIVWANNEDITNPHLIYPGDKIIIRKNEKGTEIVVVRAKKSSPEEVYTPEEFVQQKEKTVLVSPEYSGLLYVKTPLNGIGEFVENTEGGGLAILGDMILVKMQTPLQPGQGFALVSKEKEIRKGSEVEGILYKIAALAKVVEVQKDIARCKILYSIQEVEKGDLAYDLTEIKPLMLNISFPQIAKPAEVLDLYGGITKVSAYDVVFFDIGEAEGITPGSLLSIHETKAPYESFSQYRGMALVFKTLENSSMGIVMESRAEIEKGFLVKGVEK